MLQNSELLKQLKQQIQESVPKIEGTIKATEKSYGFLETDKGKSYFVAPPEMKKVLHGDRVIAKVISKNGKDSAELESLVEPALNRFIGRVTFYKEHLQVLPDYHLLNRALPAVAPDLKEIEFKEGDWVVAELKQHAMSQNRFQVCITRWIARDQDNGLPWLVALAKHQLPTDAPQAEEGALVELPDCSHRRDLTALSMFTIDNHSTRDMDDALYAEALAEGGWRLVIGIADPSAYVAEGSTLDKIARERGYTTYLPGKNVPMLPRQLSDELCSLQAHVRRPALCCEVLIGTDGSITGTPSFFTAWIESKAKLSYDEISNWLELGEPLYHDINLQTPLQALKELAEASNLWRQNNAVVFTDRPDYRFRFDAEGKVFAVVSDPRRIAHRMVEEAMVVANICAAQFLAKHNVGLFNTHIGFEPEKLAEVVSLLIENGYSTSVETLGTIEGYSAFRRQLQADNNLWLEMRLRRYQGYVLTQNHPAPHYGMGLLGYATWTSPIRKYSDLLNHRLIKAILSDETPVSPAPEVGEKLDQQRIASRVAERDASQWLYCQLLTSAVEAETVFEGEIFDISRGGMRVRLVENGATPFIPGGMIHSERKEMTLDNHSGCIMIKGKAVYRLGDLVTVQLIKADEVRRSLIGKLVLPVEDKAAIPDETQQQTEVTE
ncbi:exoribonuclease-2 [Oceanospirillum multiglobuliferum]|uniref:Exoribonuclease II n=1 Tax=Oceanospirillum multiglobuliferum TaxID=64969 RepID=A0A1T4PCB8_9GAMM|nr:exoribonuclease II [Oceanospirillum multiglobuliferum]OPX55611.1 exoribonuclease II [Oceanospirillum multiglobuliferum]SJZ89021.1 exoribonuclease-2 [Oceanospirillum multiglobuliferum]